MKRIDYFLPKVATQITGIIFLVQILTEAIGNRKQGFEWVLPVSGALFAMAVAWTLYAVVTNAIRARGQA
jgi:hypothetical protein